MTHVIKILESFTDAILLGQKTFEVRENDRGYQKGDVIWFSPVDKHGNKVFDNNISTKKYEITYVLSGWGIKEGYVVFGIREIKGSNDGRP